MNDFVSIRTTSARLSRWILWLATYFAALAGTLATKHTDGDWDYFVDMSKQLAGDAGLSVYAQNPRIQSGPISLLAVRILSVDLWTSRLLIALVFAGAGLLSIGILYRLRALKYGPSAGHDLTALVGGVVLMFWWSFLRSFGHLDDAMVLTIAAVALWSALTGQRRLMTAVLIGVALAIKPWAIFLLPMTLHRADWRTRRGLYPLVSIAVGSLLWAPFFIADPGTLDGMRPTVRLAPDSVLRLFGFAGEELSPLLRVGQLVLALVIVTVGAWRGRYITGLLAGVAVRLAMDPGTWNYYATGFILVAVAWDLCESRSRIPWLGLVTSLALAPLWVYDQPETRAIVRLATSMVAVSLVLWPTRVRFASATSSTSVSDPPAQVSVAPYATAHVSC